MVVDVQCVFQNLANVAKCFHTKLITTHPIAKMEQENVIHIELTNTMPWKTQTHRIDGYRQLYNRRVEVMIPAQSHQIAALVWNPSNIIWRTSAAIITP